MLNPPQLSQHGAPPRRRLAQIYWPGSEGWDYRIEPTPHRLFAFQGFQGTKYEFKLVNLARNGPDQAAHSLQPLLVD